MKMSCNNITNPECLCLFMIFFFFTSSKDILFLLLFVCLESQKLSKFWFGFKGFSVITSMTTIITSVFSVHLSFDLTGGGGKLPENFISLTFCAEGQNISDTLSLKNRFAVKPCQQLVVSALTPDCVPDCPRDLFFFIFSSDLLLIAFPSDEISILPLRCCLQISRCCIHDLISLEKTNLISTNRPV